MQNNNTINPDSGLPPLLNQEEEELAFMPFQEEEMSYMPFQEEEMEESNLNEQEMQEPDLGTSNARNART